MLPPTSTICSTVVASLTFTQLLGAASQLATADRLELPAVVRRRNTPCHFCSDSSSCPLDGSPGYVHGGADCRARCIYGCAGRRCGRARPVSGLTPLVRIRLVGRVAAPRQASRQPESGHSSPRTFARPSRTPASPSRKLPSRTPALLPRSRLGFQC